MLFIVQIDLVVNDYIRFLCILSILLDSIVLPIRIKWYSTQVLKQWYLFFTNLIDYIFKYTYQLFEETKFEWAIQFITFIWHCFLNPIQNTIKTESLWNKILLYYSMYVILNFLFFNSDALYIL